MRQRNTIQKALIKEAVVNLKTHPSAEEIYMEVIKTNPNISKATVYRNLGIMAENGEILKIEIPNSSDRFDFNTADHFHARCEKCDRVYDIKVPNLDILDKVKDEHFIVQGYDLVFKGICKDCREQLH